MEDKDKLVAAYVDQKKTLAKVEKALEITKGKVSSLAKQILDGYGKGPHLIDGREMMIIAKGDTCFFTPAKAKKDASAAVAPPPAE